jgi:hypothetical protein
MFKSRQMRWMRHVACMGDMGNIKKNFGQETKGDKDGPLKH